MRKTYITLLLFVGLCLKIGLDYVNLCKPTYLANTNDTTSVYDDNVIYCSHNITLYASIFIWNTRDGGTPVETRVNILGGKNFVRWFACNNTIVIGGCENEEFGYWGVYYIRRNVHHCRRQCTCFNLFLYNIDGTLCRNDSGALGDMRDVNVKCICHQTLK
jgi:hypothetical protein